MASARGQASGEGALRKRAHRTIRAVSADVDRFKFNTAVSKLMTLTSEAAREHEAGGDVSAAREAAEAIVRMVAPVAPQPNPLGELVVQP